jgi:nucleotide-binding universal stress UspA family protein
MILVGLDGSKNSEKVLPLVRPLLAAPKSRALLVTVLPPGDEAPEAASETYLEARAAELAKTGAKVEAAVLRGDPGTALVREAEKRKAELVAIASHGEGGLQQWIFGSTAQKVLRGTSRPVLVARSFQAAIPKVARVLVPLDGSVGSEAALPLAVRSARAWEARVVLLFVGQAPGVEAKDSKLRHWAEREKRRMAERFDQIAKAEKSVEIEGLLDEGDPAARIVHHAEKRPGTLIAMGSHGRTGVSRWVFGSVSEKVLQACRAPLLVTRR